MVIAMVVLLVLILVVLIGILLNIQSIYDNSKYIESIHDNLYESKQSLDFLTIRARRMTENIESISHDAIDINSKIDEAIKSLEESNASFSSDLKVLQDALSNIERSLDIIVAHPAFTLHENNSPWG